MCLIHPRLVRVNKMDGQRVPHEVMRSINVFVVAYAFIFILSLLIISLNCEDLVTCFTSVATTLNNVGPGLSLCGPTCNFGFFPPLSKACSSSICSPAVWSCSPCSCCSRRVPGRETSKQ